VSLQQVKRLSDLHMTKAIMQLNGLPRMDASQFENYLAVAFFEDMGLTPTETEICFLTKRLRATLYYLNSLKIQDCYTLRKLTQNKE